MCESPFYFQTPYAEIHLWKFNDVPEIHGHGFFYGVRSCEWGLCLQSFAKGFYAPLLSDIIGYTVSPADVRKRWKVVDEDRAWNKNERYPMLTCTPFLPAPVSCHSKYVWIRIRNSRQLSQCPWESDVCGCEQSALTAQLMSSITMMDAKLGRAKLWRLREGKWA